MSVYVNRTGCFCVWLDFIEVLFKVEQIKIKLIGKLLNLTFTNLVYTIFSKEMLQ